MYIKHDDVGKITSVYLGCSPSDADGFTIVPDDEDFFRKWREENEISPEATPTPESRITALEQTLDALIGGIMDAV